MGRLILAAVFGIVCGCGGKDRAPASPPAPSDGGSGGDSGGGTGGTGGTGDTGGTGGTGTGDTGGTTTGGGGTTTCTTDECSTGGGGTSGGGGGGTGTGGGTSGGSGTSGPGVGGTVSGGQIPPGQGPVILFSTYFGGSGADTIDSVVVAPNGDIVVAGYTSSTDLVTTKDALEPSYPGGASAGFVARLSGSGELLWSTFVGGAEPAGATGGTRIQGLDVDATGAVYVAGTTTSQDLGTAGTFQPTNPFSGVAPFVAKLTADGAALVWATYLSGSTPGAYQDVTALAIDDTGAAYVAGISSAGDFPITPGTPAGIGGDAPFLAKLDPRGKDLVYSFHVRQVSGIAVNASHELAFSGILPGAVTEQVQLCLLAIDGSKWKWCASTHGYGGSYTSRGLEMNDAGDLVTVSSGRLMRLRADGKVIFDAPAPYATRGATLDAEGDFWTVSSSWGPELPTVNPVQAALTGGDVYLTRVRGDGVTDFATYFGGSGWELPWGVATDTFGDAIIVGLTQSADLPVVAALQPAYSTGALNTSDGFIAKIRPFSARFTVPRGDDHHVWATVEANRPIMAVDARVNGGAWQPLTQDATGLWTVAIDVPPSSAVELRATGQGGVTSTSCRLYWPYAEQFPPPGPFTVKFIAPRGNDWYVALDVAANAVVTAVDVRVDAGEWQPLAQASWGAWAASIHVPAGSTVQVRVTAADGSTVQSPAWSWPPP